MRLRKGMTLVEVLLSISVMSALFIAVTSKIDIGDVFAKLLNTGEEIAVRAYGEALTDYRWDNGGDVPGDANLASQLKFICKETVSQGDCIAEGGVYLGALIENQTYLVELIVHQDYVAEAEQRTGYKMAFPFGAGGRVKVTNPDESEEFVY